MLALLTIGEADIPRAAEVVAGQTSKVTHRATMVEALSARIEMEVGELSEEEAAVFREDLGLEGSSLERVIRLSYQLLGLISFFTAGTDETRAGPSPTGRRRSMLRAPSTQTSRAASSAPRSWAGSTRWPRFDGGGPQGRRAASEGKTYRMRDGDVAETCSTSRPDGQSTPTGALPAPRRSGCFDGRHRRRGPWDRG